MKRILYVLLILILHTACYAGDPDSGYGTHIAVEFKVDNKSYKPPVVGHLEYTGFSIDIVSIFEGIAGVGIHTLVQVYLIVEKNIISKGVHHIKGKNQYGTIASGTIDFRDEIKPKINLVTEGGVIITNISKEGKDWHKKHIPNIDLGN